MNNLKVTRNKLTILLVSVIVLAIAVFVVAQTNEDLEQELSDLIQGPEGAGYERLDNQQDLNTLKEVDITLKRGINDN